MDNAKHQAWMLDAAKGDTHAFRQLALALSQRMINLAFRLLNYRHDLAQDAVQEALIRLWQTAPRWQPQASVASYAARLVYTAAMDIHRQHRKHQYVALADDLPAPDDSAQALDRVQQNEQLLSAVAQLPDRQRDAVLLHYMAEHSQAQTAQRMATSEKSVERLLSRARVTLRRRLPTQITGGKS
jgi:RNA polymerase sigma-70 factor (ECF subfamily)